MAPVEPNASVTPQPSQSTSSSSSKSKRRSRSNERTSRTKSRRDARSRSGDRESSSSSSGPDRDDQHGSMDDDDDDDDSVSDRSSRGSSSMKPTANVRWDYRTNLIGRRNRETKAFCCFHCRYPVLLAGRLIPCKHAAFCLQCANECRNDRRNCPKCNDPITDIEKIEVKNLILCFHGAHPHSQDACLRGYTSQRDLQAHVKRRHEQTRLDSPHQLLPPTHPSSTAFPGLMIDPQQSQQQQQQQQLPPPSGQPPPQSPQPGQGPPPLMTFPPMGGPLPPPPFDMGFRPPNYGLPPQQFVPPHAQYRPPLYPPNRPFY